MKDQPMAEIHDPFTRLRVQRGAEHLIKLGTQATVEFLADVASSIGGMPAIIQLLAEYERRRLPPATIRRSRPSSGRYRSGAR
jgi:hypothetical protein